MKCKLFMGNLWGKMVKTIRIGESIFFSLDEFASVLGYVPSRKIVPELLNKNRDISFIDSRLKYELDDVRWDYSCMFFAQEDFITLIQTVPDTLTFTTRSCKDYLLRELTREFPFYTDTDCYLEAEVSNDFSKFVGGKKKFLSPTVIAKILRISVADVGVAISNMGLKGDNIHSIPVTVGKYQCHKYDPFVVERVREYYVTKFNKNKTPILPLTTPDSPL